MPKKASGNESSEEEEEEIGEQQVNIGSLYFRNENKMLFVDVILAFSSSLQSGSERKKLDGGRNLEESTGILCFIYYYFLLGSLRW